MELSGIASESMSRAELAARHKTGFNLSWPVRYTRLLATAYVMTLCQTATSTDRIVGQANGQNGRDLESLFGRKDDACVILSEVNLHNRGWTLLKVISGVTGPVSRTERPRQESKAVEEVRVRRRLRAFGSQSDDPAR
jgi:hypothetical protein